MRGRLLLVSCFAGLAQQSLSLGFDAITGIYPPQTQFFNPNSAIFGQVVDLEPGAPLELRGLDVQIGNITGSAVPTGRLEVSIYDAVNMQAVGTQVPPFSNRIFRGSFSLPGTSNRSILHEGTGGQPFISFPSPIFPSSGRIGVQLAYSIQPAFPPGQPFNLNQYVRPLWSPNGPVSGSNPVTFDTSTLVFFNTPPTGAYNLAMFDQPMLSEYRGYFANAQTNFGIRLYTAGDPRKLNIILNADSRTSSFNIPCQIEILDATTGDILHSTTMSSNTSGSIVMNAPASLPSGTYKLRLKPEGYISHSQLFMLSASGPSFIRPQNKNGDINNDNEIGPADFALFSPAFGSMLGDPEYNVAADLDRNSEVGPRDFTILSRNFGLEGD